jgi:site-specific DNA-cytosine methylase
MNVLSLFDGISCSFVALKRSNISVANYYASEIDKYAIQVSKANHPEIIQLGNVTTVKPIPNLDLLIGGSPCQDLSIAKKGRKGLEGERSGLFWEYVRILEESKPKWFILENVNSMSQESKDTISNALHVQPIMINASLVSAQNRKRLFWTNIPVKGLPEDRGILLRNILQPIDGIAIPMTLTNTIQKSDLIRVGHIGTSNAQANRVYSPEGKSVSLSANGGGLGAKTGLYEINGIRKLTPIECERLQGLPDDYTKSISNTQRYKCLGNAFNVDVICFILNQIRSPSFKHPFDGPNHSPPFC